MDPRAAAHPPGDLLVFLAWRGLLQSRLIASLLVAAVAGGVAFQIPNDANLRGYDREILSQGVVTGMGDVRVRPRRGARFADADALAATLAARSGVLAVVPVLMLPGALGPRGDLKGTPVLGVDAGAARHPFRLVSGAPLARSGSRVVVGTSLAARLRASIGDHLELRVIFGDGAPAARDDDLGRYTVEVAGLASGSFLVPEVVVVDRAFLAAELGEPHAASVILVHLADHAAARDVAAGLASDLPEVDARAWNDDSPFVGSSLAASAAVGVVSRTMVVLAVILPVWALLYVHVLHRQRQVGILAAIGLGSGEIFAVYLLQAALIGIAGAAVGCVLGGGLVAYFEQHPVFESAGFVIRPVVAPLTFVAPAMLVFVATLVAGALPAWRAARLDPATILRGTT